MVRPDLRCHPSENHGDDFCGEQRHPRQDDDLLAEQKAVPPPVAEHFRSGHT